MNDNKTSLLFAATEVITEWAGAVVATEEVALAVLKAEDGWRLAALVGAEIVPQSPEAAKARARPG